jgi:hypothetical protein
MTIWYIERAGGILAYALLSSSVILGLTLSGRAKLLGWPRFALEDVHRFVGLLTAAGTDRATVWALALYIGTASVVAGLTAGRCADTLTGWTSAQPSRQSSPLAGQLRDP